MAGAITSSSAREGSSAGKRRSGASARGRSSSRKPVKRRRPFNRRWLWLAAFLGVLWGLLWQAPASWLSAAVWRASGQRVLLAQAQGTWHNGSALLVLEGGAGSRGATVLPGMLHWTVRLGSLWRGALQAQIDWPTVSPQALQVDARFGLSQSTLALRPAGGGPDEAWQGALPLSVLEGLGTPWNTVALQGQAQFTLRGLHLESVAGRMRLGGQVQIDLPDVASRLSVVAPIGSYTLNIVGQGADAQVALRSDKGPLLLEGKGVWNGQALQFLGTGRATPGNEAAMANLLSLLGRRDGDHVQIAL
ncbi:type II secretion system protein N [Thiomonas intermedia]|uniref:type II secretion system protein N n=1 Tax=Thiomonas intermedia TaxID=926 RepID=UPI0009A4785E|nr:type II secretion system protein N [Thiomonas intermedia]